MDSNIITIVSGLPRSGTSMMMAMLEAGGLEILSDGLRKADDYNPRGYYEFEPVKKLKQDQSWMGQARGKAVKIISHLLPSLPAGLHYRIILMRRDMAEILASQRSMMLRRGLPEPTANEDARMAELFKKDLGRTLAWLAAHPEVDVLEMEYQAVVSHPSEQAGLVNAFFGNALDAGKMESVADRSLYRQRKG